TWVGESGAVDPGGGVRLTFSNVTGAGYTYGRVSTSSDLTIPNEFQTALEARLFFSIHTTATFSGPVTVCLPYVDDFDLDLSIEPTMLKEVDGTNNFAPLPTKSIDTVNNIISCDVTGFSQSVVQFQRP